MSKQSISKANAKQGKPSANDKSPKKGNTYVNSNPSLSLSSQTYLYTLTHIQNTYSKNTTKVVYIKNI